MVRMMQELIDDLEPFMRRKDGTQQSYKVPCSTLAKAVAALAVRACAPHHDALLRDLRGLPVHRLLVAVPCPKGDQLLAAMRDLQIQEVAE